MYLLDTNICIFYLKAKFDLDKKIAAVGLENCYISEITIAEMRFGAEKSERPIQNRLVIDAFQGKIQIIPVFSAFDIYAREKARLQKVGMPIDDFDLLIGATAIAHDLIMVTNNTQHFNRITNIQLEDWTKM
jgi:tRNA(fMet)-specific endonuclease VapC